MPTSIFLLNPSVILCISLLFLEVQSSPRHFVGLKGCQGGGKISISSLCLGLERAYSASSQPFLLSQTSCKTWKRTYPLESCYSHSTELWFLHYSKILLEQLKDRPSKTETERYDFSLQLSQFLAHSNNVGNGKIKGDRNVSPRQS